MRWVKRVGIALGVLTVLAAAAALAFIGPRNLIGMWRYDRRREGSLRVGDKAPDVSVVDLDGKPRKLLAEGPRLKIDLNTGMYRYELESEAVAAQSPATSAAPAITGDPAAVLGAQSPTGRACPPGKQCLLFYPKEAQEKAKEARERASRPRLKHRTASAVE